MKKLLLASFVGLGLVVGVNASESRDTTFNIYGVGAKSDKKQNSSAGAGIMFDSEDVKVKIEATSDFIKSGMVLKFNPFDKDWYFKVGANYINQKIYSPVDTSTRVNQYSGALSSGYMLQDSLYIEVGGSYTQLSGTVFGDYEIKDESTSIVYLEVAKRWETSVGTLDTTANAGQVFYEFRDDEVSYGLGLDYYPMDNTKLGLMYQEEEFSSVAGASVHYSFLFADYVSNLDTETYQATMGVKLAFTSLVDVSTWSAPTNIKSHLSELHRFEGITFSGNMAIQSTAGVQKTQVAIDRDAPVNYAPTWTADSYDTGITVDDADDDVTVIKDLGAVSSDVDGDVITYSIVSIAVPHSGEQTKWDDSIYIDNGVLKLHNLKTNNPDEDGTVTVTVKAEATGGSNNTDISFTFEDVQ